MRILKSLAYSGGPGPGVPAQKVGLFVTAGGRTCGKVWGSIVAVGKGAPWEMVLVANPVPYGQDQ